MNIPRPRLTAADVVARAVPRHLREEYRRFGYVTDLTMSALTERAARQWPDRPALVQAERRLSYRELLALVERAAGWLAGIGAGPGDVVCWQTPNWWEAQVLGLARQKIPVGSHFLEAMPMTPSGKVKKFELAQIMPKCSSILRGPNAPEGDSHGH